IRAAIDNLQAGQITQGASTIEQQLVRNLYLSDEQSATRKIREAWLATQMADEWSKRKILTEYLNVVPYGAVTYGCQAAALRYFDRPCSKLTMKQAALLAGLPQNPITYNPLSNKAAARARRNEVLAAMLSARHITQAQYDTASSSKLGTHPGRYLDQTGGDEGYFVSWVRQTLEEKLGRNTVKKGGLAIHTTLDPRLQAAAHNTLHNMMSWSGAGDGRVGAVQQDLAVQHPGRGLPPGRVHVQDVHPRHVDRRRLQPEHHIGAVGASVLHVSQHAARAQQPVGGRHGLGQRGAECSPHD